MVLIQSIHGDVSTTEVLRWLLHWQVPFVRINDQASINGLTLQGDGAMQLRLADGTTVCTRHIKGYWYRRGLFAYTPQAAPLSDPLFNRKYARYLQNDSQTVLEALEDTLKRVPCINSYTASTSVNKLRVLKCAQEAGFAVPETLVTTSKQDLEAFFQKHGGVITKPIGNMFDYVDGDSWYPTYTVAIEQDQLDALPPTFHASLFQALIEKRFEIRVFYLKGRVWSMAIFSQTDDQTTVDFRNYNYQSPNRTVPYQLPHVLEAQVTRLMQALQLETGSIDLIYSREKKYVFLEVNPIGQFGMMSVTCNYYLEKEIAQLLKSYETEN